MEEGVGVPQIDSCSYSWFTLGESCRCALKGGLQHKHGATPGMIVIWEELEFNAHRIFLWRSPVLIRLKAVIPLALHLEWERAYDGAHSPRPQAGGMQKECMAA